MDNNDNFLWPQPPPSWRFEADSPHVWALTLRISLEALRRLAYTLSPDEVERAERFRFDLDRQRFIAGRGLLRRILGRYLSAEPSDIEFDYGPNGKPSLAGDFARSGLIFNLAHCEDLALVAVIRRGMIGVDVERVRSLPDADDLASRFFSPRERSRYRDCQFGKRPAAFFNIWTRKEAWLKATGEGIGCELDKVEPADLCRLHDLAPAAGFAGALALAPDGCRPNCWRWNNDYD
jgi:4'-phosphopantetheinyl transferase